MNALEAKVRIDTAAVLLGSWLSQARRMWATEEDCLLALLLFKTFEPRLSEEEARAVLVVAVATGKAAVGDDLARALFRESMGHDPADDVVVYRTTTVKPYRP